MKIMLIHSGNKVEGDSSKYTFVHEQGSALQKLGCEVEYFAVVGKGVRGYLRNVKPLQKIIAEFKPDIVHAHFGLCGMVAVLAAGKNVPVVITCHNGETLSRSANIITSLAVSKAAYAIYVEQHIRDLSFVKAKNYSIIPCGVPMEQMVVTPKEEARKQLGWSPNKKYILFGGAFENKRKNYELLKAAVDKLLNNPSYIKHNTSGIECVEMKGLTRSQCVLRMCACDVFALPSHSEGSPQALKEAMAVNCPCLATDIADVRVLFGDEPGLFVLRNPNNTNVRWDADENSLDDMVALLKQALAFDGRTQGRARILALQLSNEQIAKRLMDIYKQVLCKV